MSSKSPSAARISSAPPGADIVPGSARDIVHAEGVDIVPYVAPLRHPAFIGKPPPSGLKSRVPTQIPLRRQAQLTLYIQNPTSKIQNDEAPKPFRFRGFIYPLSRRSPQGRRRMAAIYSRSSRCERRPRRSCVAAETGRGTCRPPRPANGRISSAPPGADIVHAAGVDFVRPPRGRISFPILHGSAFSPLSGMPFLCSRLMQG